VVEPMMLPRPLLQARLMQNPQVVTQNPRLNLS
jgi:hypothetical protein